jgi:uncharacterized membrane protein SirB2
MRQTIRWFCIIPAAVFVGFTHDHTDEIPVVLGIVLILSAILGLAFPQKPWLTGFLLGIPVFIVETMVHLQWLTAPYPPSAGIPWVALFGLVPAMGGAMFGSAVRHLNKEVKPAD